MLRVFEDTTGVIDQLAHGGRGDDPNAVDDRPIYIRPRVVNVFINVLKGRVIGGFAVKIQPQNQIVDHVFRYFERENRQVSLVLPALYYFSQTPLTM